MDRQAPKFAFWRTSNTELCCAFSNHKNEINFKLLSSTGYESKTNTDEVSKVLNNKFPGWYVNKVLVGKNERLRKEHTDLYHHT